MLHIATRWFFRDKNVVKAAINELLQLPDSGFMSV